VRRHVYRLVAGIAAAAIVLTLGGCFADPEYDKQRVAFLEAAIRDFGPRSFGNPVCDVSGGESGLGKGFYRWILFSGTDSWQALADRFLELGYNGVVNDDSFSYGREDGIVVTGSLIESPGSSPVVEKALGHIDCTVPAAGGIALVFLETPGGSGP
jgi:hypothetical protein